MSKGRNTQVISVRVPDAIAEKIKVLARRRRVTVSELLNPVLEQFSFSTSLPKYKRNVQMDPPYFSSLNHSVYNAEVLNKEYSLSDKPSLSESINKLKKLQESQNSPILAVSIQKLEELEDTQISSSPQQPVEVSPVASVKLYPGTGRNEPCPCGSGKKYKKCCGC